MQTYIRSIQPPMFFVSFTVWKPTATVSGECQSGVALFLADIEATIVSTSLMTIMNDL